MKYMFCRHRVIDFSRWYDVFSCHKGAQEKAGFKLLHLLRNTSDPNEIIYLFALKDLDKALVFTETSEAYEAAEQSGVVGEVEMLILTDENIS